MKKYLTNQFNDMPEIFITNLLKILNYCFEGGSSSYTTDDLFAAIGINAYEFNNYKNLLVKDGLIEVDIIDMMNNVSSIALTNKAIGIYKDETYRYPRMTDMIGILNIRTMVELTHLTDLEKSRLKTVVTHLVSKSEGFITIKCMRSNYGISPTIAYKLVKILKEMRIITDKTQKIGSSNKKGYFLTPDRAIEKYNADYNIPNSITKEENNMAKFPEVPEPTTTTPKEPAENTTTEL
jgi:hypothetical protein